MGSRHDQRLPHGKRCQSLAGFHVAGREIPIAITGSVIELIVGREQRKTAAAVIIHFPLFASVLTTEKQRCDAALRNDQTVFRCEHSAFKRVAVAHLFDESPLPFDFSGLCIDCTEVGAFPGQHRSAKVRSPIFDGHSGPYRPK